MTPVMLSIAGSDCSAGAGIQADIKTGFALGCYPLTVVTCVVSEVPGHVAGIAPLDADIVASQLAECLRSFPVAAVKTGMLYSPEILRAVVKLLPSGIPLVADPVMVATAGDALMLDETLGAYEELLFPRASLITPNLDELACLTASPLAHSLSQLEESARTLAKRTACAVLAKGGHLNGDTCTDVLHGCPLLGYGRAAALSASANHRRHDSWHGLHPLLCHHCFSGVGASTSFGGATRPRVHGTSHCALPPLAAHLCSQSHGGRQAWRP